MSFWNCPSQFSTIKEKVINKIFCWNCTMPFGLGLLCWKYDNKQVGLDDQFLQLGRNDRRNAEKSISIQCYFTILFVKWMPQILIGFSTWWDESKTKARFTSKQNLLKLCLSTFFCSNAQFHSNKIWANDQKTCSKAKNNAQ